VERSHDAPDASVERQADAAHQLQDDARAVAAGGFAGPATTTAHVLALQRTAGNQAVSGLLAPRAAVQRAVADDPRQAQAGASVQKIGIVATDEGVNLRETPSPDGAIVKLLPLNQRLFVDRLTPDGWCHVILQDGSYGYAAASHVNAELPEPTARLHRIKGGEHALAIVKQYFKGDAIEWGQDERFYVNVLVLVNEEAGRKGIYKPAPDAAWDDTQTRAGSQIWIPSVEFAQSMKGKVSSGSLSYEAYQAVKGAVIAAAELVVGSLAFVAGLLHGALESLWDVLAGLAHLVGIAWDIIKSLLQGEFLSDARNLMEQISKLSPAELAEAGLDWLDKKWNDPDMLSRWHFRGWIIGYAVIEILMLVFSGGIVTGLKWAGKAGKFSKLLSRFPQVAKLSEAAKAAKGAKVEKLVEALKAGRGADEAGDAGKAAGKAGEAADAGKAAQAGDALETGADASKLVDQTGELASVFRRGGKIRKVRSVSLKRLRNVLGRAGVSPSGYKLQKAPAADLAALAAAGDDPGNVYGWMSRIGSELVRDSKGRPIINFTPKGLSSLEEAVKTFGHEAKHIQDFAAGMTTSSEALAELAGENLWLLVSKKLKKK
jgi:Bacterial SH3 domain